MSDPRRSCDTNRHQVARVIQLLEETFAIVLTTGYYGTFKIEGSVQDGVIQSIRESKERSHKVKVDE